MKYTAYILMVAFFASCSSSKPEGETMPEFNLQLSDSITQFSTASIASGSPIALMYFSPDCEHCQKETSGILQKMDSLKQVRFYLVTNDELENMLAFKKHYGLDKYSNITVGRDKEFFMIRHFKGIITPYMVIYDKNKRQAAVFSGETTPSQVISAVNNL